VIEVIDDSSDEDNSGLISSNADNSIAPLKRRRETTTNSLSSEEIERIRTNKAVALERLTRANNAISVGSNGSSSRSSSDDGRSQGYLTSVQGHSESSVGTKGTLSWEQIERIRANKAAALDRLVGTTTATSSSSYIGVNSSSSSDGCGDGGSRHSSSSELASSMRVPATKPSSLNAFQVMRAAQREPRENLAALPPPMSKFRPPAVEMPDVVVLPSPEHGGDGGVRARQLLARDGVVLFRGVASAADLAEAEGKFWSWLERTEAGRRVGLKRQAPATHKSSVWKGLGYANTGILASESAGQSEFMWHCRQLPKVAQAFAQVFDVPSSELASSFDGCGAWRNYWLHGGKGSGTITEGNWFHLDQAFHEKPAFDTVQGLLNFYPTTEGSGSTVMCLGSHVDFEANCAGKPRKGSFVRLLSDRDKAYCRGKAATLMLQPGDLLLWDSRTVHCSSGVDPNCASAAEALQGGRERAPLARLVAYISMLPRARLGNSDAERAKVGAARRAAVLQGLGSGHDPRRMRTRGHPQGKPASNYTPPDRDDPRWALV